MTNAIVHEETIRFVVTYQGPDVEAGLMDARILAPAMYSTAMAIEHGAQLRHGAAASVKIDVNADFQRGSFSYELITAAATVVSIGAQLTAGDVRSLISSLKGTIDFVKWLKRREVKEVKKSGNNVEITVNDGSNITVNSFVFQLSQNPLLRKDIREAVAPLSEPGVEIVSFDGDDEEGVTVGVDDLESFDSIPGDEELMNPFEGTELLQIIGISFKEGNKWRFARPDGSGLNAAIEDPVFLKRIAQGEDFRFGDSLFVTLRSSVARNKRDGSMHVQFAIIEVKEHLRPSDDQRELFDENGN